MYKVVYYTQVPGYAPGVTASNTRLFERKHEALRFAESLEAHAMSENTLVFQQTDRAPYGGKLIREIP